MLGRRLLASLVRMTPTQTHAEMASSSTRPLATTTSSLSAAQPQQQPQQQQSQSQQGPGQPATCWTTHQNERFAIRPSLLSPLYTTYRDEVDRHDRRQLISRLLEAHMILSKELEGFDANQVTSLAGEHAQSLRRLASELQQLAPVSTVGHCTDRKTMLGFYTLLEKQLGNPALSSSSSSSSESKSVSSSKTSSQSSSTNSSTNSNESSSSSTSTSSSDSERSTQASSSVRGEVGTSDSSSAVWQAWEEHFVSKYRNVPSLEPLATIYAKQDIMKQMNESTRGGRQQTALQQQGGSTQQEQSKHGAFVDVQGVACAEGKRKTSKAIVRMWRRPSDSPHNTPPYIVNGVPYCDYFTRIELRQMMLAPLLMASSTLGRYCVSVDVRGGGNSSQAQAARTGIARALRLFVQSGQPLMPGGRVPELKDQRSLRWLRSMGRWDSRSVERKKPGREKARKSFAWVKR